MNLEPSNHPDPGRKKILALYAAYGAGLVFSIIPMVIAAFLSIILLFGVLAAAYIMRSGADKESLVYNHMTFTIRTVWIGSFLASFTTAIAAMFLFYTMDNTPLDPCIATFLRVGPETVMVDVRQMQAVFSGCFHSYISVNIIVFVIGGAIAAGPVLIYFLMRYGRALSRASAGYRIAHPEAWF